MTIASVSGVTCFFFLPVSYIIDGRMVMLKLENGEVQKSIDFLGKAVHVLGDKHHVLTLNVN